MFQFTIEDIIPHEMVDMSTSEPLTAECYVTTSQGNTIYAKSATLKAQINTEENVTDFRLSGELFEEAPSSLPAALLENSPGGAASKDDYIYVRWTSYVYHAGNQPFTKAKPIPTGCAYPAALECVSKCIVKTIMQEEYGCRPDGRRRGSGKRAYHSAWQGSACFLLSPCI